MYANWSQSASIYHSEHLNHTNPLNSRVRNKRGWHLYFTHLVKIMQPSSFVPNLLNSLIRVNPFPLNEIKTRKILEPSFLYVHDKYCISVVSIFFFYKSLEAITSSVAIPCLEFYLSLRKFMVFG